MKSENVLVQVDDDGGGGGGGGGGPKHELKNEYFCRIRFLLWCHCCISCMRCPYNEEDRKPRKTDMAQTQKYHCQSFCGRALLRCSQQSRYVCSMFHFHKFGSSRLIFQLIVFTLTFQAKIKTTL